VGYLAAVYQRLWISLAIPFATTLIPTLTGGAGADSDQQDHDSSDAHHPGIFWIANRWGQAALQKVLGELCRRAR
jgi:hypothetical protein